MTLEMKKSSKWWYAKIQTEGKRSTFNLDIEIEGVRPLKLSAQGDAVFEASRIKAQRAHDDLTEDLKERRHTTEYIQKLHEARTGRRITSIPLENITQAWDRSPTKGASSVEYIKQVHSITTKFVTFVNKHFPTAATMADIESAMAMAFVASWDKKIAPRTYNVKLTMLQSVFTALAIEANILHNPFKGIPKKRLDTVHREPFTEENIKEILKAAKDDDFMRPLIVTGICTAMRLGDCCAIAWEDVDLEAGFINVKTSKTGEKVEIPIFPMMAKELGKHKGKKGYIFPAQAAMHKSNHAALSQRFAVILKHAKIERDMQQRKGSKRQFARRGFHSFRVTWITLALSAGVPMQLVQRVTGHRTVDVVLKHYFKPGRKEFQDVIRNAMPKMMGSLD